MQLQGVKEENTFSQVFDNSTEKPPHFNFKISTFLLFDGNRKKVPTCEVVGIMANFSTKTKTDQVS